MERLQKVIANSGVCSRRKAEDLILAGKVKVDGKRWSAYSNQKIDVNSIVKVLEIDGVKLKVERIGEWFYGVFYYFISYCGCINYT